MHSIGETLRSEREKQTRSLSDIATQTCISPMYLEAIERDDVDGIPGFFFYKSFVKQYASLLGIEYSGLADAVAAMEPHAEPDPLPALSVSYQPARTPRVRRDLLVRHAGIVSALTVVMFIAATAGTVSWWQRSRVRRAAVVLAQPAVKIAPEPAPVQPPVETPKQEPARAPADSGPNSLP
jgi:cytoskeletal protein RodZ